MAPQIVNLQNFNVPEQAQAVLLYMFADYERVVIKDDFASIGYSGSWVYRVDLVKDSQLSDLPVELPVVAKVGLASLIRQEKLAYESIRSHLPIVAELWREPVFPPNMDLAGLGYQLVGGGIFDWQSLRQYYLQVTLDEVRAVIENRLFRVIKERTLRLSQLDFEYPLRRSYDGVLPVNLLLEPYPPPDQNIPLITPDTLPRQTLQPGHLVWIAEFVVTEVNPRNQAVTLNIPSDHAAVAYRLRLQSMPEAVTYHPGQVIASPVCGIIKETRHSYLIKEVAKIVTPDFLPTFSAANDTLQLPNKNIVPNPLKAIDQILQQTQNIRTNYIHGDLNLENILIDIQVHDVRLIDFADSRRDHVLHDFLRLETEVITKLIPPAMVAAQLPTVAIYDFYLKLHHAVFTSPPMQTLQCHPALEKPFAILKSLREVVRDHALYNHRGWQDYYHEYYQCLTIYLLAALKFKNLDCPPETPQPWSKQLAFLGAAIVQKFIQQGVEAIDFLPTSADIAAHLDALRQSPEFRRWSTDDTEFVSGSGKDKFIDEAGRRLLPHASPYTIPDDDPEAEQLLQILRDDQHQQILVLGEAGIGKTTILERLMWEVATDTPQEKPHIPILIRLLDFGGDLWLKITEELRSRQKLRLTTDDLEAWLDSQQIRLTLMFDSLNEIPGKHREAFFFQISSFMHRYPEHRYIITSRVWDDLWERLRQTFPTMTVSVVQRISKEQIKTYLRAHLGNEPAEKLWREMDPRLRALAQRPLMLWLIKEAALEQIVKKEADQLVADKEATDDNASDNRSDRFEELLGRIWQPVSWLVKEEQPAKTEADEPKSLPRNRGELFDNFVWRTLKREDGKGSQIMSNYKKRRGLICLAWQLQLERCLSFSFDKAVQIVSQEDDFSPEEATQLIEEASLNGLVYGEATNLRFIHQCLQEHFAANRLQKEIEAVQQKNPFLKIVDGLFGTKLDDWAQDDWWAEPFIHTAGLMAKPEWLIDKLAYISPWLAYWCMDEGPDVPIKLQDKVEQGSIGQLIHPTPRIKRRAVEALIRLENSRVLKYLPSLIDDDDTNIGHLVYQTFIKYSEKKAEGNAKKETAELIIESLLPMLVEKKTAEKKIKRQVRRWVVDVLARHNDEPEVVKRLMPLLDDHDEVVSQAVYKTLLTCPVLPVNDLIEKFSNRSKIIRLTTKQRIISLFVERTESLITHQLLSRLKDNNSQLRSAAVNLLIERLSHITSEAQYILPNLTPLVQDKEESIGQMVYQALINQHKIPLEPLKEMLNDSRENVRLWTVNLMTKTPDPAALETLIPLLQDRDKTIAQKAYDSLLRYNERPTKPLLPLLDDSRPHVRHWAVVLLAGKDEPAVIETLAQLLTDPNEKVSQAVYNTLMSYTNLLPTPFLLKLKSSQVRTRLRTLNILQHCCQLNLATVRHLIPLLKDDDDEVGDLATQLLLDFGNLPRKLLLKLLVERRAVVRNRVIKLLIHNCSHLEHKPDFIHIPAGAFRMGSSLTKSSMEKPEHEVELSDYWISRQPITVAQYNDYLVAQGEPSNQNNALTHPKVNLSWLEAQAYCQWLSKVTGLPVTLPSEAQWEKAARGTDGRLFPWGNDRRNIPRCNTIETNNHKTVPVDQYSPQGDSPYGCQDMLGNAWEWTSSAFEYYPYRPDDGREAVGKRDTSRTVRGGSFNSQAIVARVTSRDWRYPDTRNLDIGFRIAITFPQDS